MTWKVPTVAGIQGVTAVMTAAFSLLLFATVSPAAAVGCAVGGAVMIANFFLLAFVGRWILAIASQSGGANRLGIVAAPLKLLFIVTVVAWLLSRTDINVPGFVLGLLTQLGAIFVETWRVSMRAA
jgi:ATP synthase I chain